MPDVQLQLIDGTMYADSGRVETISGVIDQTTGSVTMRALFPNKHNVLRSGSTGNVVFPNPLHDVIMIPQAATTEIQTSSSFRSATGQYVEKYRSQSVQLRRWQVLLRDGRFESRR